MRPGPDSLLTLDGFLAEHPWPERFLRRGKPLEWLWEFELTCEPAKLWPHLIDTSRLNRALGLGEMKFEESAGVMRGRSVNGGRVHEWIEEPWTWVSGQSLTAVRDYSRGFAEVARAIYRVVHASDRGPRLLVYFGWIPRGLIGKLALKVGVPPLRTAYARVLDKLQADVDRPRPAPYVVASPPLAESAMRRVDELRAQLGALGVDRQILERLGELLTSGDELELYRIQPRRLAHDWNVSERALLSACLHATRVGLLDLSWDVICPHCRGVRDESPSLSGVANRGACEVCQIDFSTDLENAVEVTFHVHASIRDVPKRYFCSAEPATKQHIKLQQHLEAGAKTSVGARLERGRYRIRLRGDRIGGYLSIKDDGDQAVAWRAGDELGDIEVTPKFELELANPGEEDELFVIEDVRWADEALRPSMLFAMQEFRDLFSEEYLGSDVQLSVGEQTLMFTDMVGSTAFYREHGDPAAFVKVKTHFESVFAIVTEAGGAVVKTIGDAVMAVFNDPIAAVRASREINLAFPKTDDRDNIRLRVSVNRGPCIAVNLNTGVDYFGGTVNTAAKLQACAEGGEVALSKHVYDAPGVADYLREIEADIDERTYEIAGLATVSYVFWKVS